MFLYQCQYVKFRVVKPFFSGAIQLICSASQVSGFCMVWIFTVKNIRTDYRYF